MYELLSKTSPFNGIIIEHTIHNILNSSTLIKGHLSEPLRDLLSMLLAKDPNERPTTEKILRHEWILNNLPKYDISFLRHPAFRNFHNIHDILKHSSHDLSPTVKVFPDIRKMTFFGKVNSKHQIFLMKNQEEETKKFPNIFHDGRFEHSYVPKSRNHSGHNKSAAEIKSNSHLSASPSQRGIFAPMRDPCKISSLDDEYETVQHVKERHSLGNQEEQRFSSPVEVERRRKNEAGKKSVFADSQKLYRSTDAFEKSPNEHYSNANKASTFGKNATEHYSNANKANAFEKNPTEHYSNANKVSHYFMSKEELATKKQNTEYSNNNLMGDLSRTHNEMSGISLRSNNRSNNQGLYFDRHDQSQISKNRNFYI